MFGYTVEFYSYFYQHRWTFIVIPIYVCHRIIYIYSASFGTTDVLAEYGKSLMMSINKIIWLYVVNSVLYNSIPNISFGNNIAESNIGIKTTQFSEFTSTFKIWALNMKVILFTQLILAHLWESFNSLMLSNFQSQLLSRGGAIDEALPSLIALSIHVVQDEK